MTFNIFKQNFFSQKIISEKIEGLGIYSGDVSEDSKIPNGIGEVSYEDGGKYVGDFVQGFPQGIGVYFYPTEHDLKLMWKGDFAKGKKNGNGMLIFKDGNAQMIEYENGVVVDSSHVTETASCKW